MSASPFVDFLIELVVATPMYLCLIACLVVCIVNMSRYPRPALLALLGFGLLLLNRLVFRLFYLFIYPEFFESSSTIDEDDYDGRPGFLHYFSSFVSYVFDGVSFILLLLAVFIARRSRAADLRELDEEYRARGRREDSEERGDRSGRPDDFRRDSY